jgi:D-3-phosphoglycerate dehydrogenase
MQSLLYIGNKNSIVGKLLNERLKKKKIKVIYFNKKKIFLESFIKRQKLKIDFLWTNFGLIIDNEIIKLINNPKLILISQTTGLNHINFNKKKYPKIRIISLKNDYKFLKNIPSTAEHTFALFLALSKNIVASFQDVKQMNWRRNLFLSQEAKGQIFGIIGYGRIGKILRNFAKSFGMKVLFYDIKKSRSNSKLNDLLKKSDVVSLNIDYNLKNKNFLKKIHFDKMKNTSYLINTSRGENISQKDLLSALKDKKIAGAALDVMYSDSTWELKIPPKFGDIIDYSKNNSNLLITPHIGGYTNQGLKNTFERIFEKMIKFIN